MRFPAAYYLILIYITVMFKPIMPIIRDCYAHTFGEAIHLATIHAKFGSNHLEKALATTGDNSKDHKNIAPLETTSVHIFLQDIIYNFDLGHRESEKFLMRVYKLSTIFLPKMVPPPKH